MFQTLIFRGYGSFENRGCGIGVKNCFGTGWRCNLWGLHFGMKDLGSRPSSIGKNAPRMSREFRWVGRCWWVRAHGVSSEGTKHLLGERCVLGAGPISALPRVGVLQTSGSLYEIQFQKHQKISNHPQPEWGSDRGSYHKESSWPLF